MNKKIKAWFLNSGNLYSTEYQAILNMNDALNYSYGKPTQKTTQDTFLTALKNFGILSKLDTLKVLATDASANFTDINWINPSTYKSNRIKTPKFNINGGFTFNAVDNYIDMNWGPSDGTNYVKDSAEIIVYLKGIAISSNADGVRQGDASNGSVFNPLSASTQAQVYVNRTNVASLSDAQFDTADGLYFFGRTAAGSQFAKKGSGARVTSATASTGLSTFKWWVGALNGGGSILTPNNRTCLLFASGGVLTTQNETDFKTAWDAYLAAIAVDAVSTNNPSTIGEIYNKSSWADLSDWTSQSSGCSVVANALSFSGGTGTFVKTLGLTNPTKCEKWTITARFTIGTLDLGFGIGVKSISVNSVEDVASQAVTNVGQLKLYKGLAHSAPAGVTGIPYNVNDNIEMTMTLDGDSVTATVQNITTASGVYSQTYPYTSAAPYPPNIGRFCIYNFGGSFTCTMFKVVINEWYQPKLLFIGDSKTQRYFASRLKYAFPYIVQDTYGPIVNHSGSSETTADYLNHVYEIINYIKPSKVLMCGASNDKRFGVSDATMKANYSSIVSQLEAAGITVIHTTGLYETPLDQSSLQAYINANYLPAKVIDSVGTVISLNADNIHPNDAGHTTFGTLLLSSGKL